jgi:hypothetical protein
MIIVTVHPGLRAISLRQLSIGLRPDNVRRVKTAADAMDVLAGMIDAELERPEDFE